MARCVEDPAAPPPPELRLLWQCKRWGVLPEPGGLADQPAGLLDRLAVLDNVHQAWTMWTRRGADGVGAVTWMQRNPEVWPLVSRIIKLRTLYGKNN